SPVIPIHEGVAARLKFREHARGGVEQGGARAAPRHHLAGIARLSQGINKAGSGLGALLRGALTFVEASGVLNAAMISLHPREPHIGQPQCEISQDRKSTRLNSSHVKISYAVFCLKKKKKKEV